MEGCRLRGGTVALCAMFALLGLILAFTYASGVSRYEARKQALVSEANALGTAFLRANLIEKSGGKKLQKIILESAKTRLVPTGIILSEEQRREILNKTLQAQAKLWPTLEQALKQGEPGPNGLFGGMQRTAAVEQVTNRLMRGIAE